MYAHVYLEVNIKVTFFHDLGAAVDSADYIWSRSMWDSLWKIINIFFQREMLQP